MIWNGFSGGGKRPKFTFIGWKVSDSAPPVTWFSNAPRAVVCGGGSKDCPSASLAARRPAMRPIDALSI